MKHLSESPFFGQRFEGVQNCEMEEAVTNVRCTERVEENEVFVKHLARIITGSSIEATQPLM
jgi:hypothetical protein